MTSTTNTPTTPATPAFTSAPSTPTGSWRHPAMDMVARHQSESTFTDVSMMKVVWNLGSLAASWLLLAFLKQSSTVNSTILPYTPPFVLLYGGYVLWSMRLLFCWNVVECLLRLVRAPDDFANIALTPDQRKSLGLNPNTPLSGSIKPSDFVTPPRYSKSTPTSRASSPMPSSSSSPTLQRKAALTGRPMMGGLDSPSQLRGDAARSLWGGQSPSPLKKQSNTSSLVIGSSWAYDKNLSRGSR